MKRLAMLGLFFTAVLVVVSCPSGPRPDPDPAVLDGRSWSDSPSGPLRETVECEVTRIVDGDTLHCAPFGRIRLIGIDSPEAGQSAFGARATRALAELVPVGRVVEIELDVEPRDRYDRMLGYIWSEGEMVNWIMIRTGYAVMLTYPPNVQYVDAFRDAQSAARSEEAGLWAVGGFACEPVQYRRGDCS